ncbi:MAG: transporter substrate-binding domain-containing protein [Inhella sp.]
MTARRLVLLLTAGLLATSPVFAQPGKLRIGVEGAYPPFSEVGADGKLKGFEIDLAQAYCAHMKAQCELVQIEFDGLIPALQSRKIDAIIASLAITEARRRVISFSKPYYSTPQSFAARAGTAADISPQALKGKRIGVQSATINEAYVNALYPGSQVMRYQTQDQIYLDLKSGRIDYTLVDKVSAQAFIKTEGGRGLATVGPELFDSQYFGIGVGVGMRKADEKTLGARFNAAIDAARADGSFQRLSQHYFGFDVSPR